jgi:hypothetical protein
MVQHSDYWRRSPATAGGIEGHKEWGYFCVLGESVDLIVNLSIMDRRAWAGGAPCAEEPRTVLLARTSDAQWHGDVEFCDANAVDLRAGHVGARFGASTLAFGDDGYRLNVHLASRPIGARVVLRPAARPALARSVPLGSPEPMHWLVVPRLEASGEVRIGDSVHRFQSCPAYHDHNWGRFSWGGDFAWEWGVVLAGRVVPWSLVYYRITDRARCQVIAQGLLLWRGDRHSRTFRDRELGVHSLGRLRLGRCLRVPRIMTLAVPGTAADIPRCLAIEARSGRDALDVVLTLEDGAQIGIPNECDERLTLMSECRGSASVSGSLQGETVRFEGPSVVEFNRAA